MSIQKLQILGNDFIGAWVTATDKFFLLGREVSDGEERMIGETLGVRGVRTSINGSGLVGVYAAMNSNCILLPHIVEQRELGEIRENLPNIRVEALQTIHNALKNNILVNDRFAIINPDYSAEEERLIGELLDVETLRLEIGGFKTVGANNILTNRGLVLNNRASEEEKANVEKTIKLRSEQSTANTGSLSVGLCAVANSRGLVAGQATTGFELSRIAEALEL